MRRGCSKTRSCARHQGKNDYCTHIGNELFAWFQSTESKSRINFLEILRAEHKDYVLGSDAIEYMRANNLPRAQLEGLGAHKQQSFANEAEWNAVLEALNITQQRHVRITTEGQQQPTLSPPNTAGGAKGVAGRRFRR